MSRYRPVWLEVAEQQYRTLPNEVRILVDRRLAELVEDPTSDLDAVYNEASDQWSVTLGEHGFLFFAIVHDPSTVIILRLIVGLV